MLLTGEEIAKLGIVKADMGKLSIQQKGVDLQLGEVCEIDAHGVLVKDSGQCDVKHRPIKDDAYGRHMQVDSYQMTFGEVRQILPMEEVASTPLRPAKTWEDSVETRLTALFAQVEELQDRG